MAKVMKYHPVGAATVNKGELVTYVVECDHDRPILAHEVVRDQPNVHHVLGIGLGVYSSLDACMDFVQGRNGQVGLCYDRTEMVYEQ